MIPDSFKQDLLNRVDIVEVVGRYVRLKKAGANFSGLCPFHNEKTPSFSVSPAKQFYHCFGCGAHGNAIGFLMAYGGMGYVDAVKDLAGSAGLQMPEWKPRSPEDAARQERATDLGGVMEKAMEFFRAELKRSPKAIDYLKGRGLTGEIAARFRIGYAPDDWQGLKAAFPEYADKALVECGLVIEGDTKRYDRFRDRVMFPIFSSRGGVIGFGGRVLGDGEPKYLNSPETPLFEKGREVYGLVQARDAIRQTGRVLVVEGSMDVVALAQFGVGYAVATLGTATTPVHVTRLLRLADEVIFCFDGDNAGRKAAWRALEVSLPLALDHKPMRFLFLPKEDDPDTYVRKHGKDAFEELARGAPTLSTFLVAELRAQADLGTAEGRAGFLSAAKPHLQKIAAPALKIQLVKEVAELARVTQEEAEAILEIRTAAPSAFRRPAPPKREYGAASGPERKILAHVAAYPALARGVDLALLDPERAESALLARVREWAVDPETGEEPTSALLIDRFGESRDAERLFEAQARADEFRLTREQSEAEVALLQRMLALSHRQKSLRALEARSQRGELSREEMQAYAREIAEVKQMESEISAKP